MNKKSTDFYTPQWPDYLPDGWEFVRTDWVATEHRETVDPNSLDHQQVFHYSIPVIEETGDGRYEDPTEIRSKKLIVQGGEVLVSKLNPGKSRVLQTKNHSPLSIASGEFIPLRANENKVLPKYLKTVFLSEPVRQYLDGIATSATRSHQRVNPQEIRTLRFPKPPVDTQQKILSYLSYNIDRIDALIKKNKRLLELFEERRFATISQFVTNGFAPNETISGTGNKWVRELPANWEVVKLKFLTEKIGSGVTPDGGSEVYVDDGIAFIRSQNVLFEGLDLEEVVYIDETTHAKMQATALKTQDVLLNITGSIGRCSLVSSEILPANVNQHVCIIRPRFDLLDPAFLNYVVSSYIVQNQIFSDQQGASRKAITLSQIGDFVIPLPPRSEQKRISSHLDQVTEVTNTVYSKVKYQIDLLEQKRRALISAVITGRIDVSDWGPRLEESEVTV